MKKIGKLAIFAGGDILPILLAEHCQKQGISHVVFTFKNQPQPDAKSLKNSPCQELPLGALKKAEKALAEVGATHVVMAGRLDKVSVFNLRPDAVALKLLLSLKNKNDNTLLSALGTWVENLGLTLVGAHELLPELVAQEKVYTKKSPSKEAEKSIELGLMAAKELGRLDIGQAVVVKDGVVLGVEGVEGTNALVERCAPLRGNKGGSILVKCAKPQQTLKIDMPTVGPQTVQKLVEFGYAGLVVEAEKTLMVNLAETLTLADKNGVFICGRKK